MFHNIIMAQGLPVFPSFSVRERHSLEKLVCSIVGLDITDVKRKRALLLHYAGDELFDTLEDTGTDYATALTKLNDWAYYAPKKSTEFELYKFRQANSRQMRQYTNKTPDCKSFPLLFIYFCIMNYIGTKDEVCRQLKIFYPPPSTDSLCYCPF